MGGESGKLSATIRGSQGSGSRADGGEADGDEKQEAEEEGENIGRLWSMLGRWLVIRPVYVYAGEQTSFGWVGLCAGGRVRRGGTGR